MSCPFALWISQASAPPPNRSGTILEGTAVGRCPEAGQALSYWAPFSELIPLHFSGLATAPRGQETSAITIAVREPIAAAGQLVGGLVLEAGIQPWPLAAALKQDLPGTELAAARVSFTGEHCWGLIRRRRKWISLVLVGGPVWRENPWNSFDELKLEGGVIWTREDLTPVMFGDHPWGFVFPALRTYSRGVASEGVLVDRTGAIVLHSSVRVVADELPFRASVMQQENGYAQFLLEGRSRSVDAIQLPLAA